MIPTARPYQTENIASIYKDWSDGARHVCLVSPTGSGKTFVGGRITADYKGYSATVAHRNELVLQQSMMLASLGVRHRVIASKAAIQFIRREHTALFNRHYIDNAAPAACVAVDTLRARAGKLESWTNQIGLCVMDECHHVLRDNKWGEALALFPNAVSLGATATSNRADGKGIGKHAHGVYESQVNGPSVRTLIDNGYLTDYDPPIVPPSDFNVDSLKLGGTGDFTRESMIQETRRSKIVGDVVQHYQKFAPGRRAIVFAVDIQSSGEICAAFVAQGIKAASVNGKTSDFIRAEMVRRFKSGDLDVLINVDLFGEGFDVPACEVVIMARPTQSLPLYLQMFGRALRPFPGKRNALVIDHVGNVVRHLLPDTPREWNLDAKNKSARAKRAEDAFPIKVCIECFKPFEAIHRACPYCGHIPEPAGRGTPEQVDGDLLEMTPEALEKMRMAVNQVMKSSVGIEKALIRNGTAPHVARLITTNHDKRRGAQYDLIDSIGWWAGTGRASGQDDHELHRRFFFMFGTDVLTAQTLSAEEAGLLADRIRRATHVR